MTEPTKPNDNNKESGGEMAHRQQQLVDMGSSTVSTGDGTIHTLTIVGQIEGHQETTGQERAA